MKTISIPKDFYKDLKFEIKIDPPDLIEGCPVCRVLRQEAMKKPYIDVFKKEREALIKRIMENIDVNDITFTTKNGK